MKKNIAVSTLLLLLTTLLWGQNSTNSISVERSIDWEKGSITFYLTAPVEGARLPFSKQNTEGQINRLKTSLIIDNMNSFPLDSWGNFISGQTRNTDLNWNLHTLLDAIKPDYATFTSDFKGLCLAYTLSFTDITGTLSYNPINRVQLEVSLLPSEEIFDYTGLVIYAATPLPLNRNKAEEGMIRPTLLPSVFSEKGQSLLNPYTMIGANLRNWGTASYSYSDNSKNWPSSRVGAKPLVVAARSLSGINSSDVVIGNRDAERLLSSSEGRKLLNEGRVLIILPTPVTE
jgi:hypothetical protein